VPYKLDLTPNLLLIVFLIVVAPELTKLTAPTLEPIKLILPLAVDEYPETNVPLTNILTFTKGLNELNSTSFSPHFSSNFTREPNILRSIEHGHVIKGLFNKPLN